MNGEIGERANKIKAVYRDFLFKLFRLEKKEDDMIRSYLAQTEEDKVKKIRQNIASS